ncbi:SpaA isopeptide-forming pilin-related protein [Enterococcus eurekensis]|uniref:SpaA isopeptide-forming pilin-related protein n=1 Tax=Enterococcus eurekensis TaxID=1159753 RepID=A0ABV9M1U1_9ENTE
MRKKGMVWFSLLLLLISFLPSFLQAYVVHAQSPDEVKQTVIQSNYLNVSTTAKQVDQELLWEIDYSIGVPAENHTRRIKIKVFNQDERNVIQPEQLSGWVTSADNWFQTEALSQTGKGKVVIRTALDVKELQLKVQLDEEVINEIEVAGESPDETTTTQEKVFTENILEAPFANSHTLSAPIVQASAESTSSSTSVEESPVETTEADSQVTETDTSEESTNTTETSKTESSPSESSEKESTETSSSQAETLINNFNYNMGIMPFAVAPYVDPFAYTPDGGKFPTHGTNNYTVTLDDLDIKNYNYSSNTDPKAGVPPIKNVLSGNMNFDNGYHAYKVTDNPAQDIYMKKIAMPTDDPTKFKIQLDMIGGYLETRKNVDVVFVVDKSGSMQGSNWSALNNALSTFANGLLGNVNNPDGAVKLGLASFGGVQENQTWRAFGEVGNFGGLQGNYTGFTTSASSFLNHKILTVTPTGGTPTFLGLDAGLELLTNTAYNSRSNAEKVLIILTDGQPTYAPTGRYTGIRQTSTIANNRMTRTTPSSTVERFTAGSGLFTGDGSSTPQTTRDAIISHANSRTSSYPGIERYAIGFNVDNVGDILAALGPKGQYSATNQANLTTVLNIIKQKILDISSLIRDAKVFDPMSQYVDLNATTVKTSALQVNLTSPRTMTVIPSTGGNYPEYAQNVVIDKTGNKVNLSNLTLSGSSTKLDGFRVEYEVTLKDAYQDGKFYPTNGPTYLADENYPNPFGFAVPSVKHYKTINIPVEKIWNDDNNDWNTRQDITLQLQRQNGSNWENVANNAFAIAKTATGNALKHTFSNLPSYANGQAINYRIVEIPDRVLGYDPGVTTPVSTNVQANDKTLKMTNNLKKIPLGKFTKINQNGDRLTGVKFKLFKSDGTTQIGAEKTSIANGEVDFSDIQLPVGTYILRETEALPGYETAPDKTIIVTDTGTTTANLVITGLDEKPNEDGNQVVNHLRLFTLKVTKEDNHGNALEGATFTLKRTIPTPETPISGTTNQNIFTFAGLSAGTYILTETSPPNGYIGVEAMTVVISANGQVTINGVVQEATPTEGETLIELTVKNKEKGQLPSTGGHGTQQFLVAALVLAGIAGAIAVYYVYRNRKEAE